MSMARRIVGYLHYEKIPERGAGHQYRVADDADDVVRDFGSEVEAAEYVTEFNAKVPVRQIPKAWRGHPLSKDTDNGQQ